MRIGSLTVVGSGSNDSTLYSFSGDNGKGSVLPFVGFASSSLVQVTEYMAGVDDNTTIKNKQIAKRLVGRVYKGIVEVFDVDGDDNSLTVTSRFPRTQGSRQACWGHFKITKPEVIKKAAELPKGAMVSITAKLSHIDTDRSSRSSQAAFSEVQSVDVVPAEKTTPKN